jgi:hypothetical protein
MYKYYSVDKVRWQDYQLAYGPCTIRSETHYSTSTVLPLTELCNNSSMLSECTGELSVLYYSFFLTLDQVWKMVTSLMVWNTFTTTGCLQKRLAAYHGHLWSDTILPGTLFIRTAPEDGKHVFIWNAANHVADYSEYHTMDVTWYKDLQLWKLFVIFTFRCYGVLSDKPNCMLRNVSGTICHHSHFSNIHSYQYSVTNVKHFSFNLLSIKGLHMFQASLAHPLEALQSGTWYIACVLCQFHCNPGAVNWHNTHTIYQVPLV